MEETYIRKRNSYINSLFELTPAVSEKIILLNEKLRAEEIRIFDQYRLIEKNCNLMLKNKIIDGFNMHFELSLFNNKHYKKYEPSLYGNSFFQHVENFIIHQCVEAKYNFKSYNEFVFPEINHCYSFHSLYEHCNELTWFDIYNIDEVWMEIKVDYQFIRKIKP
jgi:hypothetical protein